MPIVCGMATVEVDEDRFAAMLAELKPHLDERQWRLTLGAQARALGRGGISRGAGLTGPHPDTGARGARALEQGIQTGGGGRPAGAGRPAASRPAPGAVGAPAQPRE